MATIYFHPSHEIQILRARMDLVAHPNQIHPNQIQMVLWCRETVLPSLTAGIFLHEEDYGN